MCVGEGSSQRKLSGSHCLVFWSLMWLLRGPGCHWEVFGAQCWAQMSQAEGVVTGGEMCTSSGPCVSGLGWLGTFPTHTLEVECGTTYLGDVEGLVSG